MPGLLIPAKTASSRTVRLTYIMKRLAALAGITIVLCAAAEVGAAPFSVVHYFDPSGGNGGVNTYGKLLLSGNTLYGLTYGGSLSGDDGSLYQVNTDGTGFS